MTRKPRRPKALAVGSRVKARAIRGPHKDGSGRWYWRAEAYDPATQSRVTIWTGWAARREVEAQVAALVASGADLTERKTAAQIATVRDLLECWLWHVENVGGRKGQVRPNTLRIYTAAARHIVGSLGDVRLDRLAAPSIEGHRDRRLRAGAAATTVRNELDVLGFSWRWWMDRAPRAMKPLPKVRVKGGPVRNRRTPSREDVLAVLDRLDGWTHLAVLLLFATGARPGEVRDLTWGDVDLDRREIRLAGKTGARVVPLAESATTALHRWAEDHPAQPTERVLTCSASTFDSYLGPHALRAACEAAGVPRFTPYGLRRAAVDAMARAGVDPKTAARFTGHSVSVMLTHYRTVTAEDLRGALAAAGLGSVQGPKVVPLRRQG